MGEFEEILDLDLELSSVTTMPGLQNAEPEESLGSFRAKMTPFWLMIARLSLLQRKSSSVVDVTSVSQSSGFRLSRPIMKRTPGRSAKASNEHS